MIAWLEPRDPREPHPQLVEETRTHPMRTITRAAAAEVGVWTVATARDVQQVFDGLAPEWHTRHTPERLDALTDALSRGGPWPAAPTCLELGSGDGWATPSLLARFPRLVAMDLSAEMLRRAPDVAPRAQADAAALPLPDHVVDVAVLVNMLLFPNELDRVLAFDGVLLWLSSRGPATPIHLTPEEVAAALPGRWSGRAARSGTAVWAALRRDR